MQLTVRELQSDEVEKVIPLLLLAEPSEGALRWSLGHLSDTVYGLEADGEWVGAATVRWRSDPCEIMELAVAENRHGQGLGKHIVAWLIAEAQRRGQRTLIVGTANS